jgi:DNA-binding NarL/FixJ family response regulator
MSAPISLLIVDDHPLARQGLIAMLSAFDDLFCVVAQASDMTEALMRAASVPVQVIITDLHFADGVQGNGIDVLEAFAVQYPQVKRVMITSETNELYLVSAHAAGAHAFLRKDADAREIARAIESVVHGYTHFPAQLNEALLRRERAPKLTARELDLLPYIARGLTAKEIARELTHVDAENSLIDRTVEVHKGNIKRKFSLDSASALITFAIEYCLDHRVDYRAMELHTKK